MKIKTKVEVEGRSISDLEIDTPAMSDEEIRDFALMCYDQSDAFGKRLSVAFEQGAVWMRDKMINKISKKQL